MASASAHSCVDRILPGFTICVPPGWVLKTGRGDSVVGRFVADNLVVKYDFGRYSDPLLLPEGPSNAEHEVTVDDRPARQVAYTVSASGTATKHYVGIHVPRASISGTTPLKLTILAESTDASRLSDVEAAFTTIRFAAPAKP